MSLGLLTLNIHIPGCSSLKEKRSRLKPLITRLQREFNISVTEYDHHDIWQSASIACAIVTTDRRHTQRSLQSVITWVENKWPDVTVITEQIEIL